jgi:hypothetical protein
MVALMTRPPCVPPLRPGWILGKRFQTWFRPLIVSLWLNSLRWRRTPLYLGWDTVVSQVPPS